MSNMCTRSFITPKLKILCGFLNFTSGKQFQCPHFDKLLICVAINTRILINPAKPLIEKCFFIALKHICRRRACSKFDFFIFFFPHSNPEKKVIFHPACTFFSATNNIQHYIHQTSTFDRFHKLQEVWDIA